MRDYSINRGVIIPRFIYGDFPFFTLVIRYDHLVSKALNRYYY